MTYIIHDYCKKTKHDIFSIECVCIVTQKKWAYASALFLNFSFDIPSGIIQLNINFLNNIQYYKVSL